MTFEHLKPFMGDIDRLTKEVATQDGKSYVVPALRNLGSVVIPVIREVVAPASFRNAEAEITDIEHNGVRRVRAVANKFKFGERARGLQVLRLMEAGGIKPQNRTDIAKGETPGDVFDMNTVVFGDGTDHAGRVLPVKAAVQYSDALSMQPYHEVVGKTFHNRASEEGTLFDPETKKSSVNLFDRSFVKPGTLLLQSLSLNGRTAPISALDHLLLCIGLAGAYGGQTSIYGVNVRTHVVGIFASKMETPLASPYVALDELGTIEEGMGAADVAAQLAAVYRQRYAVEIPAVEVAERMTTLIDSVETADDALRAGYRSDKAKLKVFFDTWFGGIGGK